MIRTLVVPTLILAAVLACRSRRDGQAAQVSKVPRDSLAPSDGQRLAQRQLPDSEALDTTACSFVSKSLHPEPRALVAEFLRRDAEGEFTASSDWFFGAEMCGGRGGTDVAILITAYDLDSLSVGPDTARYRVRYAVRGLLDQDAEGFVIRPPQPNVIDTFVVVRTPFGWRITSPEAGGVPHLFPDAAAKRLPFHRPEDRAVLDSLSRSTRKAGA